VKTEQVEDEIVQRGLVGCPRHLVHLFEGNRPERTLPLALRARRVLLDVETMPQPFEDPDLLPLLSSCLFPIDRAGHLQHGFNFRSGQPPQFRIGYVMPEYLLNGPLNGLRTNVDHARILEPKQLDDALQGIFE
jgi:hypothetical protein